MTRKVTAVALALLACCATPAAAQDAGEFYKGKQVRIVIRQAPGGSYDLYSRLIGRYIGKHIPGNPTIIHLNMPGAGGLTATNHVAELAPKDGTYLIIPPLGLAMYQALGTFGDGLKGDMGAFQWIGNVTSSNPVVITWHTSKVKTLEDAKKFPSFMASGGAGSISSQFPAIYNNLLGTKFKVLYGYGAEILAIEREEIDGRSSGTWAGYKASTPEWVRGNKLNYILQVGLKKEDELPNVPLLLDLAKNDEEKQIFGFVSKVSALTRPMSTSAGVPADRVAVLRKAFMDTMKDPEFLAQAEKQSLDVGPFTDGATVQQLTVDILNTPKPLLAKINAAMQHKAGDEVQAEVKPGEKGKKKED